MKTDMNPQAVTGRLRQTSELRRLCLALGKSRFVRLKESGKDLANKSSELTNKNRYRS